jgi:hypothetical protein
MTNKYIIEARNTDGTRALRGPQPETVFGNGAITGMSEDDIAKVIFRHKPEASLDGRNIAYWPSVIDERWIARRKTW